LGFLHGAGGGQRSGHGEAAREEEAVEPPARVRVGGRAKRPDGPAGSWADWAES
jgi:hypothetical protein